MIENWKELKGHREIYEISDLGNVRTKTRDGARGKIVLGHSLSQHINSTGYFRVSLNLDGRSKSYFTHRLVAMLFVQKVEGKDCVNHIDGNKLNNRFDNLEWVTPSENQQHAFRTGLKKPTLHYGEDSWFHKLTKEDVKYIRAVHKPWDKVFGSKPLAERFGVNQQTITDVVHGRSWSTF